MLKRLLLITGIILGPALFGASNSEIHAVWDHFGVGLYPGDWPKTIRLLRQAHVTDVYVNVAGVDFAHYASRLLPRSQTFAKRGDQLTACLAAAKGSGIRVHAWVLCFSATRGIDSLMEKYRRRGWRLKDAKDALTAYLDPTNPNIRALLLSTVDEIQANYAVSGIHLDFVRWGAPTVKPKNAVAAISQFVAEARRHVKRPHLLSVAVYGNYPGCISSVGQDWVRWLDLGLVDYVVPMDYLESNAKFEERLRMHAANGIHAGRIVVGIGVTASESKLSAQQVVKQIGLVRKYKFAGEALFDLDATLEQTVLPRLRQGVW